MKINDPQIVLETVERIYNSSNEIYPIYKFYSDLFHVIDGFEKDGSPCSIIVN
jgi:hypothetical protein